MTTKRKGERLPRLPAAPRPPPPKLLDFARVLRMPAGSVMRPLCGKTSW
jgi:hypothetical protein